MLDFSNFRNFALSQNRKSWYKSFTKVFDANPMREVQRWLHSNPIIEELKILNTEYYKGKSGYVLNSSQVFALRYPKSINECSVCGSLVDYSPNTLGWRTYCSRSCMNQDPKLSERRKQTCVEKYGADNPSRVDKFKKKRTATIRERFGVYNAFQSEEVKGRIKTTIHNKYGVDNPSQSPEIDDKKRQTQLAKSGYDHWTKDPEQRDKLKPFTPAMLKKARKTCLERYGVENVFLSEEWQEVMSESMRESYIHNKEEIRKRFQRTCMERYGIPYAPIETAGYLYREVTDKFGYVHKVQGYEPFAIRHFDTVKRVTRIDSGRTLVPYVRYKFQDNDDRIYFPDMIAYTKSTAYIVEVKSLFTLLSNLKCNMAKFRAATKFAKSKGYSFWLFLFSFDGSLIKVKNPTTLKQLREAGIDV